MDVSAVKKINFGVNNAGLKEKTKESIKSAQRPNLA